MKAGLLLIKIVLTSLAKSVLLPFGLLAAMSATDAAIQKKIYGSRTATLIISNKEMEELMKIVKSLDKSGLLIKGVSETTKNKTREQKRGFLPIILGTLAASLLGSALTRRGVMGAGERSMKPGLNL